MYELSVIGNSQSGMVCNSGICVMVCNSGICVSEMTIDCTSSRRSRCAALTWALGWKVHHCATGPGTVQLYMGVWLVLVKGKKPWECLRFFCATKEEEYGLVKAFVQTALMIKSVEVLKRVCHIVWLIGAACMWISGWCVVHVMTVSRVVWIKDSGMGGQVQYLPWRWRWTILWSCV